MPLSKGGGLRGELGHVVGGVLDDWQSDGGVSPVMRVQTYDDQSLNAIELRFEQRCEGATGALRGKAALGAAVSRGAVNGVSSGTPDPPGCGCG